ncbi:MAG: hypothetical protein RQ824_01990 [bacterium]|nr:hypothetical protein [bacterium]
MPDANGNTTKFSYDHRGRVISEADPLGYGSSYAYDSSGRVASRTDAEGDKITYSYDIKGNIITAATRHESYTFTYGAGNRVKSVTDSSDRTIGNWGHP